MGIRALRPYFKTTAAYSIDPHPVVSSDEGADMVPMLRWTAHNSPMVQIEVLSFFSVPSMRQCVYHMRMGFQLTIDIQVITELRRLCNCLIQRTVVVKN